MSKIVENEEYFDTEEVMEDLAASKKLFYASIKPALHASRFDGKKKPWYRKRDVLAFKAGKPVRKASIAITGMFGSWAAFAQSQYQAETDLRSIEVTTLPQDAIERFHLPADEKFVKRSRLTRIDRTVICTWDTYYPMEMVSDIVEPMKRGAGDHVVEYIKEKHGLVVGRNRDVYSARMTTLDEQNLFQLLTDEPVLILQRASYTRDKTLILFSDMVLLGNWFVHEHEYDVPIWDEGLSSNTPLRPPREHREASESGSNILPDGLVPLNELMKQYNLERQRKSIISYLEKQGVLKRGDWNLGGHAVNLALDSEGVEEFTRRYVR